VRRGREAGVSGREIATSIAGQTKSLRKQHLYGIVLSVQSRGESSREARAAQNGGKDTTFTACFV